MMRRWITATAAAALVTVFGCGQSEKAGHRVFVIGVDGMDPLLTQKYMDEGLLPNLKALAGQGSFRRLGTSIPPESPVAWSNFITGRNPGGHGVYDFLQPEWHESADGEPSLTMVDSVSGAEDVGFVLDAFGYELPMTGGAPINKRRGDPWWVRLEDAGVPATVFKMPANYPPTATDQKTISGMGTPDLQGGYGTYYIYTDDKFSLPEKTKKGKVIQVSVYDGTFRSHLFGPPNTLVAGDHKPDTTCPLRVDIDPDEPLARILIGDEESEPKQVLLKQGEWSEFIEADFDIITAAGMPLVGVTGLVRFYLREVRPTFQLFVDPINMSPAAPASDISTPAEWSAELAEKSGFFETKGMPENTGAIEDGVLTYDEFRVHADGIFNQSRDMLFDLVEDHKAGALFYYFGTVDLTAHMFWRCTDDAHPGHDAATNAQNRDYIRSLYGRMDGVIGDLRKQLTDDDTLIIMSDHGFAPFYRAVHLNRWLEENGYLVLKEESEDDRREREEADLMRSVFTDVDWSKTRAYNVGFASIYLNVKGRDPLGVVDPKDKDDLVDEICAKLMDEVDPKNGKSLFYTVYKTRDVYSGDAMAAAPEIVVGFDREYRNSPESTAGDVADTVIEDNMDPWSGCHIMAAEVVPGVIFTNRKITADDPKLYDLTATILSEYGIKTTPDMVGTPLWGASPE